jgi:hypothetical protein
MATSSADVPGVPPRHPHLTLRQSVDERALGAEPIETVEGLRCDAWESDEELDAFLADLAVSRHSLTL